MLYTGKIFQVNSFGTSYGKKLTPLYFILAPESFSKKKTWDAGVFESDDYILILDEPVSIYIATEKEVATRSFQMIKFLKIKSTNIGWLYFEDLEKHFREI